MDPRPGVACAWLWGRGYLERQGDLISRLNVDNEGFQMDYRGLLFSLITKFPWPSKYRFGSDVFAGT